MLKLRAQFELVWSGRAISTGICQCYCIYDCSDYLYLQPRNKYLKHFKNAVYYLAHVAYCKCNKQDYMYIHI